MFNSKITNLIFSLNTQKPFAPACERNREPILSVLKSTFNEARHVLEIGSGTGQHAVYFAAQMPWLMWQCSDVEANLPGIQLWIDEAALHNLLIPIELDISKPSLTHQYDAVYSCNTLHIMSMQEVADFFHFAGIITTVGANLIVYGPFNYQGKFTSGSNAEFDRKLKEQDPASGVRDFEWVNQLAEQAGFTLQSDYQMPANNRCLHWHQMG